jgi:hypothetical protein
MTQRLYIEARRGESAPGHGAGATTAATTAAFQNEDWQPAMAMANGC